MAEVTIFKAKDGHIELTVHLSKDTVWLTQKQLANLFDKDVRTISQVTVDYRNDWTFNIAFQGFCFLPHDGPLFNRNFSILLKKVENILKCKILGG